MSAHPKPRLDRGDLLLEFLHTLRRKQCADYLLSTGYSNSYHGTVSLLLTNLSFILFNTVTDTFEFTGTSPLLLQKALYGVIFKNRLLFNI